MEIGASPLMIVGSTDIKVTNLKDLVEWIKSNQDKAAFGTAGPDSSSYFGAVYFQNVIDTKARYVDNGSSSRSVFDLASGQIDLLIEQAPRIVPQVMSGLIRAYAVTGASRLVAAPAIRTTSEARLPEFDIQWWSGLWAPRGTPKTIISRLNLAVVEALKDPFVRQSMTELGIEPLAREQQTPEALRAFQKSEADKWWPIIKAANIKGQ
jgi:tripartite-type tricarboxylate transporter receptor subunit TctC